MAWRSRKTPAAPQRLSRALKHTGSIFVAGPPFMLGCKVYLVRSPGGLSVLESLLAPPVSSSTTLASPDFSPQQFRDLCTPQADGPLIARPNLERDVVIGGEHDGSGRGILSS